MILIMLRKLIAALLILGWISLSGFDVVEDLDEVPCRVASTSPDGSSSSKRGEWEPFVNNIVDECANRTQQADVALVSSPTIFDLDPILDFRGHVQLHKLYHVFLI
jgi:hypothetical protein